MYSQASLTTRGSRSRSRSRSTSVARSTRFRKANPVFRALSYDGTCNFTRTATCHFATNSGNGIGIGASNYAEAIFTFSPTGVTLWGSNVNYTVFPLPQAAEIAGLWDRVRIDKVEMFFSSNTGEVPANAAASATHCPMICLGNDVNGPTSGGATSLDQVLQLSTCKSYNMEGSRIIKWTINKPKYQRLVQFTSINSANEPAWGFVESNTDIPHYGVRIGVLDAANTQTSRIVCTAKFFFTAKNVK